ncbi:hypothetical protein C0992_006573 [Termitomyces sp. T32_za158]|nr:hypothetical protein C0992_006573 [Termitomyces sp. T32_za158]
MSTDNQSRRYNFRRLRPGISSPTRGAIHRFGEQPDVPGRFVSPDVSDADEGDESQQVDTAEGSSRTELKDEQAISPSQEREYSHPQGGGHSAEEASPVVPSGETPGEPDERNEGDRPPEATVEDETRGGRTQAGGHGTPLTQEQTDTIELARHNLTTEQSKLVDKQNRSVNINNGTDDRHLGTGTSNRKDKGIDPREWGQLNADNNIEYDPGTQRKLLKEFEQQRKGVVVSDSDSDSDYEPDDEETDYDEESDQGSEEVHNQEQDNDKKKEKMITELKNQVRRLKKELELKQGKKRNPVRKDPQMSEALSNEFREVIGRVTNRGPEPGKLKTKRTHDRNRPSTYIGENSVLGHAFRRIREDSDLESGISSSTPDDSSGEEIPRVRR